MKIILLAVVTLDGKIARNEHNYVDWSSKEDKRIFFATTKQAGAMILGHNTFQTFPSVLPGRLHIVLTINPEGKANIPGQLEYTNQSPQEIVSDLEARGYEQAVVAGGGQINALFLKAGLIDEIWLTVEPLIFGSGVDLFRGFEFDLRARLLSVEKLNDSGTLHLRYSLR
jgi:dihydrofolate reductase